MARFRTYRNRRTGVVQEYPVPLGDSHPDLVEVEEGAKPLAYTPIPREAIDNYLASKEEADETAPEEEDEDE